MATYFDSFRDIYQRVTITNTSTVIVDGLVSIKISQIASSDRTLKFGEFCKNSVKIVYRGTAQQWQGSKILVESVLSGVATSMGYYYVDKVEYDGVRYTITGYDMPASMDEEYDSSNGLTDARDIQDSIEAETGITFTASAPAITIESIPEGTTNRQLIGYIYGTQGKNLRVNPSTGRIVSYWYTDNTAVQIPRSAQYQTSLSQQMEKITINSLTTGTQDNRIEYGSGFGVTFWNPYITEAQANTIYNDIYGDTYYVGTVKYRGNPSILVGDAVSVEMEDSTWRTMYVMSQEFNCDGGMNATITSYGNAENTAVINKNNINTKIQTMYTDFRNALQEATEFLNGSQDGYFSLLQDNDGNYIGWQITNTPGEPTSQTSGWRWTQGGLCWSTNGFNSVDNIAITNDGRIVARFIDGLVITADMFSSTLAQEFNQAISNASSALEATNTINQWLSFSSTYGLIIGDTQDSTKATVAQMKADGFRILDANDYSNELFSAVSDGDTSEVTATNLVANNYLVLNYDNYLGRFEKYADSFDSYQIGFYFQDEGVN